MPQRHSEQDGDIVPDLRERAPVLREEAAGQGEECLATHGVGPGS